VPASVPPVSTPDALTAAIVAAALPHLKAALGAGIDTNAVRLIVREELAAVFAAISKGVK